MQSNVLHRFHNKLYIMKSPNLCLRQLSPLLGLGLLSQHTSSSGEKSENTMTSHLTQDHGHFILARRK